MTHSWREHADAVDEYRAAAQRYESKRPGLGEMFMDAVDAAIESILDRSITWGFYRDRKWTPQVYSRSVPGFPFDIVYVMFEGEVVVVPTHTRDVNPDTGRGDWRAERLVMPIAPCSCIGVPDRRVIPRLQWAKTVERTPPRKRCGPLCGKESPARHSRSLGSEPGDPPGNPDPAERCTFNATSNVAHADYSPGGVPHPTGDPPCSMSKPGPSVAATLARDGSSRA